MAGLFFWHEKVKFNLGNINRAFSDLGYFKGKHLVMAEWDVLVFPKSIYEIKNWCEFEDGSICGVGTYGYKGMVYEKALPVVFQDLLEGGVDLSAFWGSFIIMAFVNGETLLFRDGAGLTRLYKYYNSEVYSTSFAGLIEVSNTKFSFDKDAATELLTTGVLTGNNTLLKEILRINIGHKIGKLNIENTKALSYEAINTRKEAIHQQLEIADKYTRTVITDWLNYSSNGIVDVGITGGMDSRLLALLSIKHTTKLVFHTHWRPELMKNKDYKYAHIFAEKANININTNPIIPAMDMTATQLERNFEQSYCLSDGVIRPGAYWDEAYCTEDYRIGLCNKPYLRLLGFGGEQYRNGERIPLKSNRKLKSWIRWEMMYKFTGRYFKNENEAILIENRIETNLINQFGTREIKMNLYNYKKYIKLIQSPSYRSLQASMENRLGFCINPFLDVQLSAPAEITIPFLGQSLDFQLRMIRKLSPDLAAVPNGYGFNFAKGEPLQYKIGSILWQNFPTILKYKLYAEYKKHYFSDYIFKLKRKHRIIEDILIEIEKLKLPLNLDKHLLVRSRSKLVLNLGYFILRNSSKIIY